MVPTGVQSVYPGSITEVNIHPQINGNSWIVVCITFIKDEGTRPHSTSASLSILLPTIITGVSLGMLQISVLIF